MQRLSNHLVGERTRITMDNDKTQAPPGPRGLTGPIFHGWSAAFFGRVKPSPVITSQVPPAMASPPARDITPSDITATISPTPPVADSDQVACPGTTDAKFTDEIAPVESEPPTDKPRRQCGTAANLIELVPPEGTIPKKQLIVEWRVRYGNHQRGRALLEALIADRKLFEWHTKRAGTNPAKSISRHPQPLKPE